MPQTKAVLALSGGTDSATLLGYLLEQGADIWCCFFHYGSRHNDVEYNASMRLVYYYRDYENHLSLDFFDVRGVVSQFATATSLLKRSPKQIPEGHYTDAKMKSTVVPARNTIFLSMLMGKAETVGAPTILFGAHEGDHAIYPDCRPEYVAAMNIVMYYATEGKVQIEAPLMNMTKHEIIQWGLAMKVPFALTTTCYNGRDKACGKCGSCVERLEAFEIAGVKDPIDYE